MIKVLEKIMAIYITLAITTVPIAAVVKATEVSVGFCETFESFTPGTVSVTRTNQFNNGGWRSIFANGSTDMDIVIQENTLLDGQTIKAVPKNHAVIPLGGIYRESNISLTDEPVIVSADIYLPTAETGTRQIARFFTSRGTSESEVTQSEDVETPYVPINVASFGLSFDNKSGSAWNVYMMEPSVDHAFREVAVKTNGEQLQITGDEKITVEYIYYPTGKMVYYYINGEQISTSTWGYEVKMDVPAEMGNVVFIVGSSDEENGHASFDNVKAVKTESDITGDEGIGGAVEAYAKAGNPAELINIASIRAIGEGMENATVDNENVWRIEGDVYKYVMVDIQESFGNSAVDGSSFLVEIEYYDEAFEVSDGNTTHGIGFFSVWVDDLNYGAQMVKHVPLLGDNQWKKVTIELDNAAFSNGVYGIADIMLSLYDIGYYRSSTSYAPLNLKSLKVTKLKNKNPVLLESYAEAIGNTFEWYEEEKQIKNIFTNTQDRDINLNAEYYLIDKYGNTKFSTTENFVISANSMEERNVNIYCNECGLYEWVVKITDESGSISSRFKEDTICIVKTAEDGLKNTSAWLNEPLADHSPEMQEVALQLMNLANIRGVRLPNRWRDVEDESGLDVTKSSMWKVADLCDKYGIEYWVKMSGCSVLYQDTNPQSAKIPTTDKELAAWKNYCRHIIENYAARGVELFEIWNEPNIEAFNPTGETPAALAKVTQLAKEAATELYSEGKIAKPVKIAGLSITNINRDYTYEDWLKPAVAAGLTGGENGIDVLNLHTYEADGIPEMVKTYDSVQKYRDYIYEQTGVKDIPVLISEYGNSTANTYTTEESKRDWLIRSMILYRMKGIGQQVGVHRLAKIGYLENSIEDNYGIVSSLNERANIEGKNGIPTETYLSYAAMNYVLRGEVTPIEMLDCGENIKINRLSRKTLGDEVIALWAVYDDAEVTLDLGVNSVTYYDKFGNKSIMTSSDGTYKIPLTTSVVYITGDFTKAEVIKTEKQMFYDGFSDYTNDPWGAPDGWILKSLSDSEINTGTNLLAVSDTYGQSVSLASIGDSNGYFRHPALYKNVGYVTADDKPVKFHTDVKITNNSYTGSIAGNSYHIAVSNASDIEDYIMGFKLVGETSGILGLTKKLRVHYWDEEENAFVQSDTTFDVGDFVSLDAIYYPASSNKTDRVEYYVNDNKAGEAKSGIGSNNSLETVMLASFTKKSNGKFPAQFDNVCIMPNTEDSIFFEEKRHSEDNGTFEFKTTAVNMSELTDTVTIITAFYDEQNRLLDAKMTQYTLDGKFVEMSSGEKESSSDGVQVKFLIWDMDGVRPLSKIYKVRYN